MPVMLPRTVPADRGNEVRKDGALTPTIRSLLEEVKAATAYFLPENGKRGGMMVLDMNHALLRTRIGSWTVTSLVPSGKVAST